MKKLFKKLFNWYRNRKLLQEDKDLWKRTFVAAIAAGKSEPQASQLADDSGYRYHTFFNTYSE